MEWIHRAFVLAALPIAAWSFAASHSNRVRLIFGVPALFGSALLFAGAFVEQWHDFETGLTVSGAMLLAGAHLYRWRKHQSQQS